MTPRNPETIVERRTRILKLEGDGFPRPYIVKTLSKEYQCCTRTIQRDIQIRDKWQPKLSQLSDKTQAFYSVLNRYEQIYRKASFTYLQSKNESVTIAALRVMLDALTKIGELTNITEEEDIEITEISQTLKRKEERLRAEAWSIWWSKTDLTEEEREGHRIAIRLLTRFEDAYNKNPELYRKKEEKLH